MPRKQLNLGQTCPSQEALYLAAQTGPRKMFPIIGSDIIVDGFDGGIYKIQGISVFSRREMPTPQSQRDKQG